MKQTPVEWLEQEIFRKYKFTLQKLNCQPLEEAIQQAKEIEKQEKDHSDELFKHMVYHMVGGLAHANNMTFNGAILDELFNKFKKEIKL